MSQKHYKVLQNEIREALKPATEPSYKLSVGICYALHIIKSKDLIIENASKTKIYEYIKDETVSNFMKSNLQNVSIELLRSLTHWSVEDLQGYLLYSTNEYEGHFNAESLTPDSLNELAIAILEINDNEKVLDSCSGVGSFLRDAYANNNNAKYYGVEINADSYSISKIRAEILGGNITLKQGNVLEDDFFNIKFDKAFSNYPFAMRIRELYGTEGIIKRANEEGLDLSKASSADWLFNYSLVSSLKENGRALAITTQGSLWNTMDRQAREFFINKNLIKAVISLPEKLFSNTGIPVTAIVFEKNNGPIVMIDARDEFVSGRRQNTLSKENINKIVSSINSESEIAKLVTVNEVAKNDFVLSPSRHFDDIPEIKDGVEFSSVIKNITRGAPFTAKELDSLASSEATNYQYIMLSNIQDGIIDTSLPYLKQIEDKYLKYCVATNSILLSKNGPLFKIAVADIPNGKKILACGNLFIIELDENKINPYYLKAMLESELGTKLLNSITVGAVIPTIGVAQLKQLIIPLKPIEEQKEIANRYLSVMDEIAIYKRKITKANDELKNIFDKGV